MLSETLGDNRAKKQVESCDSWRGYLGCRSTLMVDLSRWFASLVLAPHDTTLPAKLVCLVSFGGGRIPCDHRRSSSTVSTTAASMESCFSISRNMHSYDELSNRAKLLKDKRCWMTIYSDITFTCFWLHVHVQQMTANTWSVMHNVSDKTQWST